MELNDRNLPFKLTNMSKGAQKAYRNFISFYGLNEGRRIYLAKASEQGTGKTIRQKVNSVYRKGARL
jgi:hypothetical protein